MAIVAVLALIYFGFSSLSASPSLSSTDASTSSPISQNLLVTLTNLRTIKLDGSIFSDPTFVSLTDFGVVIPPPPSVGRTNPFAPASASTLSAAQSSQNSAITPPSLAH